MADVDALLLALDRALGPSRVTDDLAAREAQSHDESGLLPIVPRAVVYASEVSTIATTLALASAHGVSVTPRAAATGKAGGAIPDADGIALVLTGLDHTLDVNDADAVATADAGVITKALVDAADQCGLFYGPDPSSLESSTLGGNVAVNAGGPSTLKYGATRDWLLSLDVVLASGETLHVGRSTHKGVGGYDLLSVFAGSEGTLGIVTRATFRLIARPETIVTAFALLERPSDVPAALSAITRAGLAPKAIELLDETTLSIARLSGVPMHARARAALLVELDGNGPGTEHDLARLGEVLETFSVDLRVAQTTHERARLWQARRDMSQALRRRAKHKLSEDIVVPPSALARLFDRIAELSAEHGIEMPAYGHAGSGNLHVNFLHDDLADRPRVELAMRALFESVAALGGGLSGEHGIGRLKAPHRRLVHGAATLRLERELKQWLDPRGILNPGKVLPP